MLDLIKKSFFSSIGMAYLTKEKVEEIGKKFIKEANLKEEEGKKFVDELLKKSEDARSSFDKAVNEKVELVLKKLNIPSREEISEIKRRLSLLEGKIGKAN